MQKHFFFFLQGTVVFSRSAVEGVYDGTACVIVNTASGKILTGKFYHKFHLYYIVTSFM